MGFLKCVCFVFAYYMMMAVVCVNANVVLMANNASKSFDDAEATFTPKIKGSGECGLLYLADPLDACSPLMNKMDESLKSPFALIVRGECTFDDKIRNAQSAGFKAAIVYDFEDKTPFLIKMGGTPEDINIHAVFISKDSGKELMQYSNNSDVDIWILPTPAVSKWWSVSFIILFATSALVTVLYFGIHTNNDWQERDTEAPPPQEFHGMSRRLVKAMPSLIFTAVSEDKSTSITCAICLEDYSTGERIRILPCCHKFHAKCVDSWLTSCRTFCPVCKRDARTVIDTPPASDSTPLLSSASSSSSTINLQSYHSSLPTSPLSIPITSSLPLTSRNHFLSNTPHFSNSFRPSMPNYITSNSVASIYRHSFNNYIHSSSNASPNNFVNTLSAHSVESPTPSRYSSRYIFKRYNPSSRSASPSYVVGTSSRRSYLNNESNSSLSALPSSCSLPS